VERSGSRTTARDGSTACQRDEPAPLPGRLGGHRRRRRAVTAWALTRGESHAALPALPIRIPSDGYIRTAFAIGPGVNVIDTAGPWEVFCDTAVSGGRATFELYTVASSTDPVEGNSGLRITPRYTYENAPPPDLVIVPATTRPLRRWTGSGTPPATPR
jgi:hypothetical protein